MQLFWPYSFKRWRFSVMYSCTLETSKSATFCGGSYDLNLFLFFCLFCLQASLWRLTKNTFSEWRLSSHAFLLPSSKCSFSPYFHWAIMWSKMVPRSTAVFIWRVKETCKANAKALIHKLNYWCRVFTTHLSWSCIALSGSITFLKWILWSNLSSTNYSCHNLATLEKGLNRGAR